MTRYEQGFMNKCAEYGLDTETSLALMEKSAAINIGDILSKGFNLAGRAAGAAGRAGVAAAGRAGQAARWGMQHGGQALNWARGKAGNMLSSAQGRMQGLGQQFQNWGGMQRIGQGFRQAGQKGMQTIRDARQAFMTGFGR